MCMLFTSRSFCINIETLISSQTIVEEGIVNKMQMLSEKVLINLRKPFPDPNIDFSTNFIRILVAVACISLLTLFYDS